MPNEGGYGFIDAVEVTMNAKGPLKLTIVLKEAAQNDTHRVGKLALDIEFRAGQTDLKTSFSRSICEDVKSAETFAYVAAQCWLTDLKRYGLRLKTAEIRKVISDSITSTVVLETQWQSQGKQVTAEITYNNSAISLPDARRDALAQWESDLNGGFAYLDTIKADFDVPLAVKVLDLIEKNSGQSPTYPWYDRAERVCKEIQKPL